MIARYLVKISVALAILARPNAFRALLSRKALPAILGATGCAGALLLFLAPGTAAVMTATVLVSASEACLFVGQALVLFSSANRDILKAAMTGILLAFGIAVVSFALPTVFSLLMQIAALCSLSALVSRPHQPHDPKPAASRTAAAPVIPWSLVAVLALFSFGTQFAFVFGSIDCDWAMVYALGVLAGAGVMLLEFRVFSASRISTLDITCALFIAVPVMLVGAGHSSGEAFMSIVNVGDCLFVPRMLQVVLARVRGGLDGSHQGRVPRPHRRNLFFHARDPAWDNRNAWLGRRNAQTAILHSRGRWMHLQRVHPLLGPRARRRLRVRAGKRTSRGVRRDHRRRERSDLPPTRSDA